MHDLNRRSLRNKLSGWDALCLLLGLANTVLYASLLPLWEGFDEPFHFGYVESLAVQHQLPVLGQTALSREIEESIRLAPASHVVRQNIPHVMTFAEYHALPEQERAERRRRLWSIPTGWRREAGTGSLNYEAQQAPLAYAVQAPLAAWWSSAPLPARVWRIRMAVAVASAAAVFWALHALAGLLELGVFARRVMLLAAFCWQMLYATSAHVANDWLAVALSAWFFVSLLRFRENPSRRRAAALGAILAAGLLTKAYFLVWAALAMAAAAETVFHKRARPRVLWWAALPVMLAAAPWYARNLALYGSLSGMQQSAMGLTLADAVRAGLAMPWAEALWKMARAAVWTGNNSFNTFSASTAGALAALLVFAAALWTRTARASRHLGAELWLALGCALYGAAHLYAVCMFWAEMPGVVSTTPWYVPAAMAPFLALVALGVERCGRLSRWLGAALAVMSAYMIAATYALKLIPQYAGCGPGAMRWSTLHGCYAGNSERTLRLLADTALGSVWLILPLAALVCVLAFLLAAGAMREPGLPVAIASRK